MVHTYIYAYTPNVHVCVSYPLNSFPYVPKKPVCSCAKSRVATVRVHYTYMHTVYRIVLNSGPGVYFLPEVLDPALIRDRRLIKTDVK